MLAAECLNLKKVTRIFDCTTKTQGLVTSAGQCRQRRLLCTSRPCQPDPRLVPVHPPPKSARARAPPSPALRRTQRVRQGHVQLLWPAPQLQRRGPAKAQCPAASNAAEDGPKKRPCCVLCAQRAGLRDSNKRTRQISSRPGVYFHGLA
jgi:hypothetical protein